MAFHFLIGDDVLMISLLFVKFSQHFPLLIWYFVFGVVDYSMADNNNLIASASNNQHVRSNNGKMTSTSSGPRFQNELPLEVTFTPDRGFTLDCPVWSQPPSQINWLTSKGKSSIIKTIFTKLIFCGVMKKEMVECGTQWKCPLSTIYWRQPMAVWFFTNSGRNISDRMYTQQLTGVPQSIQLVASYPLPSAFVQVNLNGPTFKLQI